MVSEFHFDHITLYWPKMAKNCHLWSQTFWKWSKYWKPSNFVVIEVVKYFSLGTHQSINKQTVQIESHLYRIFWHICITCVGYTANFTICLPNSICPCNWSRRQHSPNKKFDQKGKEKIISSFLPSKYLSGTYVANMAGIAATLKYTRLPVKIEDADPSIIASNAGGWERPSDIVTTTVPFYYVYSFSARGYL